MKLSQLTRSVPPLGMAWSALTTRLPTTWLIWPGSISAGQRSSPMVNSLRLCVPRSEKLTVSWIRRPIDAVFFNRRAAAGKGEELLCEIAGAETGVLGVVQARAHLIVWRQEEGGEGDVADDGGEEVVEIVRDAAGQKAELLEGVCFAAFGFIALPFGDVAEDENDADDFVLAVANGGGDLLDDVLVAVLAIKVACSGRLRRMECASLR